MILNACSLPSSRLPITSFYTTPPVCGFRAFLVCLTPCSARTAATPASFLRKAAGFLKFPSTASVASSVERLRWSVYGRMGLVGVVDLDGGGRSVSDGGRPCPLCPLPGVQGVSFTVPLHLRRSTLRDLGSAREQYHNTTQFSVLA